MEYEDDNSRELEDIQHDIVEERMEYEENLARSEEDGWFYPDTDAE